jgi:serine/alanine adding enzyme
MNILINDQIKRDQWKTLLEKNPYSTPFQSPEYYDFYNSVKGFSAEVLAIDESDILLALVVVTIQKEQGITGFFSRRGIIYGGPLIDPKYPDTLNTLLQKVNSYIGDKVIYFETRNLYDYTDYKGIFLKNGWDYMPFLNFHLNTTDINSINNTISKSRLRQIKKALQSGVSYREAKVIEEVQDFYKILFRLYKTKIKKPLPQWDFFKSFFELRLGLYLLVSLKEKVIGGIMCPVLKGKVIYELYVCGLDAEYKQYFPSVVSTWAAIEYANNNNLPLFDFMGAGKPDENYGVRDFKSRFGGELVEYGRFIKIQKSILYYIGTLGIRIFSKSGK